MVVGTSMEKPEEISIINCPAIKEALVSLRLKSKLSIAVILRSAGLMNELIVPAIIVLSMV